MGLFSRSEESEHEHDHQVEETKTVYNTIVDGSIVYGVRKEKEWVMCSDEDCGDNFWRIINVKRKELLDIEKEGGQWEDVEWVRVISMGASSEIAFEE